MSRDIDNLSEALQTFLRDARTELSGKQRFRALIAIDLLAQLRAEAERKGELEAIRRSGHEALGQSSRTALVSAIRAGSVNFAEARRVLLDAAARELAVMRPDFDTTTDLP